MSPTTVRGNPMDISNFLNPSDNEDADDVSVNSSANSELGSVENSMDGLEISRANNRPTYEDYHRLPTFPIASPRHSCGRQSIGFNSRSRRRHSLSSRDPRSDPRSPVLHHRQHPRHRTFRYRTTQSATPHRQPNRANNKRPHSNKAYTPQQVAWIRYNKEDLNIAWKCHPDRFRIQFPEDRDHDRDSDQCFSSRYYRANTRPKVDENWEPVYTEDGRPIYLPDPVRRRTLPEGRAMDIPFTLVERHPEKALTYCWVTPEHKEKARRIIKEDAIMNAKFEAPNFVDPNPRDKKWRWRRVFRILEAAGHLPLGE